VRYQRQALRENESMQGSGDALASIFAPAPGG
ncbi:flagellum-specific ATP synthase FliI, partial [Pseudomonas avellanae]